MICSLDGCEVESLLESIPKLKGVSPYIYLNLHKYKKNVEPFYHFYYAKEGNEYNVLISEYDSTLQVWANDHADYVELSTFISSNNVNAVYASPELLTKLGLDLSEPPGGIASLPFFTDNGAELAEGFVLKESLTESEYNQVAELVLQDSPLKGVSECKDMVNRYKERNNTKYGRNWIILDGSKVVCHVATYAESNHLAVLGGIATDKQYRRRGLATYLTKYVCNQLLSENRRPMLFWFNESAFDIYKKMGFVNETPWGVSVLKR